MFIVGFIWVYYVWSCFWGFDVKEIWIFVIWVIYVGYIYVCVICGWCGNFFVWFVIVGFLVVIFNFMIVNVFFKGLYVYFGLS